MAIVKYLNGGVSLNELHAMDYEDYRILAHTIQFLGDREKEEMEKSRSEGKSKMGKYRK